MNIVLGADHGGYSLKEQIAASGLLNNHEVLDVGCFSSDSVDYPDYADKAVEKIITGSCELGILICGTGIGMSIAANRDKRVRAALCHNTYTAEMSREHNNANILCLGARVLSVEDALKIVETWLQTRFAGGRHERRVAKFS